MDQVLSLGSSPGREKFLGEYRAIRAVAIKEPEPELSLRHAIRGACTAILNHPDYGGTKRSVFSPLATTAWRNRARQWLPDDPYDFTMRRLDREDIDLLCDALLSYKDRTGGSIVTQLQISGIKHCWKYYKEQTLVVSDYISEEFRKMLTQVGFDRLALRDCDGFRIFLFSKVYPLITEGEIEIARRRLVLLLSASVAQPGPQALSSNAPDRLHQIEACTALLGFLGYVAEDGTEQMFVSRLQRMHSLNDRNFFLKGRLLSHMGHHQPGSRHFLEVLKFRLQGCNLDIPTYERASSASYHNAARAALQAGALLNTRVRDADGMTVEKIIAKGYDESKQHEDLDSSGRHRVLEAMSRANSGDLDGALQTLVELREAIEANNRRLKHLTLRITRVEAVVCSRLAVTYPSFRHVARERLVMAQSMAEELKLPLTVRSIVHRRETGAASLDWD